MRAAMELVGRDALDPLADLGRRRETDRLLDRERELARGGEAMRRLARETAKHDAVDRRVEVRDVVARRIDLSFDRAHEDDRLGLAVEEATTGQALPQHDGGRVDV